MHLLKGDQTHANRHTPHKPVRQYARVHDSKLESRTTSTRGGRLVFSKHSHLFNRTVFRNFTNRKQQTLLFNHIVCYGKHLFATYGNYHIHSKAPSPYELFARPRPIPVTERGVQEVHSTLYKANASRHILHNLSKSNCRNIRMNL